MDKSVVSTQLTNSVKTILTYTCMLLLTVSTVQYHFNIHLYAAINCINCAVPF